MFQRLNTHALYTQPHFLQRSLEAINCLWKGGIKYNQIQSLLFYFLALFCDKKTFSKFVEMLTRRGHQQQTQQLALAIRNSEEMSGGEFAGAEQQPPIVKRGRGRPRRCMYKFI